MGDLLDWTPAWAGMQAPCVGIEFTHLGSWLSKGSSVAEKCGTTCAHRVHANCESSLPEALALPAPPPKECNRRAATWRR
eukprot:3867824-Alexandrium_andersonii.AAC.1